MLRVLTVCGLVAGLMVGLAMTASAQVTDAGEYRVCPYAMTQQGLRTVEGSCALPTRPDFFGAQYGSSQELEAGRARLNAYEIGIATYGACVSDYISAASRPGQPGDSDAPNKAACAHSWAESQLTDAIVEFGEACIDFSNRSMVDPRIQPWDGACFKAVQPD